MPTSSPPQSHQLRVVLLHNILSPHVTPVFQALAQQCRLHVLYCADKEENRQWKERPSGFDYTVLPYWAWRMQGKDLFTLFVNPTVLGAVARQRPDIVIVSGWDLPSYHLVFWYCKLRRIPCVVWSGSTANEPSWRRQLALWPVRLMVRSADGLLAYGTLAKQYLQQMGANAKNIAKVYNTAALQMPIRASALDRQVRALREQHRWRGKLVILYYGQLIERKGVDTLLRAVQIVQRRWTHVSLCIVGSGPALSSLRELSVELAVKNVSFQADPGDAGMSAYYHAAHVFVLPSREEVWGLVVNQAMSAGLPVIISDRVGAGPDLVTHGQNGYVFPHDRFQALAKMIQSVLVRESHRRKLGRASMARMRDVTPAKSAQVIAESCLRVWQAAQKEHASHG